MSTVEASRSSKAGRARRKHHPGRESRPPGRRSPPCPTWTRRRSRASSIALARRSRPGATSASTAARRSLRAAALDDREPRPPDRHDRGGERQAAGRGDAHRGRLPGRLAGLLGQERAQVPRRREGAHALAAADRQEGDHALPAVRRGGRDRPLELPAARTTSATRCPALAAGNSVVLKPSEVTPLTSLLMQEGFRAAGGHAGRVPRGHRVAARPARRWWTTRT